MHPRRMEGSCSIIPKAPAGGLHLLRALLIPAGQQGLAGSPVPAMLWLLIPSPPRCPMFPSAHLGLPLQIEPSLEAKRRRLLISRLQSERAEPRGAELSLSKLWLQVIVPLVARDSAK